MKAADVRQALKARSNAGKAAILRRFFKTGPGEYGHGDKFIGLTVPEQRQVAKEFRDLALAESEKLLQDPIHECRLTALLILESQFARGDDRLRRRIYRSYLAHTRHINNWDLVDLSAPNIVGAYLENQDRRPLYKLVRSKLLWERRIAMLATFWFIRQGDSKDALRLAEILLADQHDLMHKASGWMLREVGKRCGEGVLTDFLDLHASSMPRTMLRYAIERLPPKRRSAYLAVKRNKL